LSQVPRETILPSRALARMARRCHPGIFLSADAAAAQTQKWSDEPHVQREQLSSRKRLTAETRRRRGRGNSVPPRLRGSQNMSDEPHAKWGRPDRAICRGGSQTGLRPAQASRKNGRWSRCPAAMQGDPAIGCSRKGGPETRPYKWLASKSSDAPHVQRRSRRSPAPTPCGSAGCGLEMAACAYRKSSEQQNKLKVFCVSNSVCQHPFVREQARARDIFLQIHDVKNRPDAYRKARKGTL
jgi:hypothetical protein